MIYLFTYFFKKWKKVFDLIEKSYSTEDALELQNAIIDLYSHYETLKSFNLIEFSNKNYTTYMHIVCHIPEIIKRFGKISIFNCQSKASIIDFSYF